ncbi:MAG: hypothetical protein IRY98_06240 [Alicyclobacillaceae bacterium]|nr:hypothetical protein [Alicyclobacillaceae bacterium]
MESAISDLASRLDRLEQQVRLLSSRSATEVPLGEPGLGKAERTASSKQGESETAKRAAVGGGGTEQGMKSASSPAAPASPAAERRASGAGTPSTVSSARWEDVRAQLDPEAVEPVRARWQEVLDEVKKRRVTTQAWLLDGEPVARAGTWLVVAFKNQIHRETVMKPMHRTVIEDVLRSLFGEQMFLYAVPVFVWQQEMAAREQSTALQDPEAAEPGSPDAGMGANDPLAQLIELFGEDKVEILEEE